MKCPNKSSLEYKRLVKALGSEPNAFLAWLRNGEEIPTVKKAKELLDIKQSTPEQIEANRKQEIADFVNKFIESGEITYTDENGNPCAKIGLTNTTKGTNWKIVKDFKGQPKHSQGGVDIIISNEGVSMRRGGKDIKAEYGLLIPNNN